MEIVGAFACSHAGLMISRADKAAPALKASIYDAFAAMGEQIRQARPDAIVMIATDHSSVYPLSNLPQFTIGVSALARGIGDAGMPKLEIPIHQPYARAILDHCLEQGVDLAYSESMAVDHSFVAPLTLAALDAGIPIVPIAQNCNWPPFPPLRRSHEVGRVLGHAIRNGPAGRVVILGTGGLSHWVGSEERQSYIREPAGNRLGRQKDYPMSIDPSGRVNEIFDRCFLDLLAAGKAAQFVREWDTERVFLEAGNGGQEIRAWLTVAGAVEDRPGTTMAYAPVPEWLMGTALMRF
jgi:hypothetical protein